MVEQRRYRVRVRIDRGAAGPAESWDDARRWVDQLNATHGDKLERPVSTRFLWPRLKLVQVPIDAGASHELRPAGVAPIRNSLLFDYRLTDGELRLYAVLRAGAYGPEDGVTDGLWAALSIPFMAAALGVRERTVQGRLARLREAGHISDQQLHPAFGRVYQLLAG